ncbi:TetR/AcrR family transcriptional regulator [Actinophytocola sp.]|uniref:TetR/AcrR family transcriptional regulator n=1 Tax=Actinophytocola sp. TaxID=1872138 RepID=UPI003D6A0B5C
MTQQVEPPPISRLERKRNKKIDEILAATNEVLRDKGYDSINLEEVADKVDLTKASLYHYFSSKEELLTSCLDRVAEDAATRMRRVLEKYEDSPASVRLEQLVLEHLLIVTLDYPHVSELFTKRLKWPYAYRAQVKRMRSEHDKFFRDVIEDGLRTGEFVCDDPDLVRRCLYGAINGVPVWLTASSERAVRDLCDRLTPILLKMLTAE